MEKPDIAVLVAQLHESSKLADKTEYNKLRSQYTLACARAKPNDVVRY